MTLIELIEELQRLRTRVNDEIEVEVLLWEEEDDFKCAQVKDVEEMYNEDAQKIVGIVLKGW